MYVIFSEEKEITMIAIKAIIITKISINFMVISTKFGSKTKLNQNLEQTRLSSLAWKVFGFDYPRNSIYV